MKACRSCGLILAFDNFHKHTGHGDGFHSICRPCTAIKGKKDRQCRSAEQIEREQEYNKKYRAEHPRTITPEYAREYRLKNLERLREYDKKRRPAKGEKKERLTHEQFVNRLTALSKTIRIVTEYKGMRFRVGAACLICDHSWNTFAGSLLQEYRYESGNGCKKCFLNRMRGVISKKRIKHDDFIRRLQSINDTIRVDSDYQTANDVINVTSLKCGHHWTSLPFNLLKGQGCPKCSPHGFQQNKPGFLYYVRILANGELFYKIGITNRTVPKRFSQDYAKLTVLETVWCENGAEAFKLEKEILREYADYRYRGPRILDSGNREIFTKDVLNLDVAA